MSVHVMSWVLRNSEETLGRRLVLLVLADHAKDDGTCAWPSVETIGREARMTRRPVQEALRRLEASGAITATGKSKSGTTIYTVAMGGAESAPADSAQGAEHDADGARNDVVGGAAGSARTVLKSTVQGQPSEELPRAREDGITVEAGEGVTYLVPNAVDRRLVSNEEAVRAVRILHVWNEKAGQALRSKDWTAKIIMRLREYPEATEADHALIIETALAHPWWRGPASPSVVYGNGAQFERSIQAVRERRREDTRIEDILTRVRRAAA